MRKKLRIQKQNSGFSLVELIIAIAILVIVTGAVCSFIIITSRNYANGNNDISVQQEAQLALNQMSDVIIDATQSINYVGYDESNQPVKALKDSEFTFTPEKKALIVYNTATPTSEEEGTEELSTYADPGAPAEDASSELHNYMFYWQKDEENLYFSVADAGGKFPMPGEADCVLLAENVTDFQVDLSQVEERRVVKLKLNFKTGTRKFEMANNITVRNKVVINNADIEPLDKRVRVSVSVKEPTVVLEPGETFHFSTPKVTGTNLLNKTVTWSIDGAVGEGTMMADAANGILKIGEKETHQSFQVKVTTTAKNDEDNSPAEATVTVYVKRVTKVTLYKKSEELPNSNDTTPGALEVMQGSTVVLGGTVDGVKLGNKCDSCGEDPSGDKYLTGWTVVSGSGSLQNGIQDSDHETATIQIKADAAVGSTITIQAASYLASRRPAYGPVQGEITLKVVEKKDSLKPLPSGEWEYGRITMVTGSTISNFTSAINSHVLAIHVVDLSVEEPEPVRYVLCYNSGWEIPLDPGFFGLNLNKRYGFYLQGIECVTQDVLNDYNQYGKPLQRASDDEIREDYRKYVESQAPFAYKGTKFRSADVYYTIMEPVQATYEYKGKAYSGENIVFDTVNLLSDTANKYNILAGLSFKTMSNIDHNSVLNYMKYSVYKQNGDGWDPIYVFDGQQYTGSKNNYNGNLIIDNQGSYSLPNIKVGTGDLTNVVGTYRIVPGIYYEAKTTQKPEHIIDPLDFEFTPNGTQKYYELPESTFYVTVTAEGTMDITSDRFTGSVCFPLPAEMKNNAIFTDLTNTEWQDANIQDQNNGVTYNAIDSNGNLSSIRFNRIRYRYIQSENAYEVEPMWETSKDGGLKLNYSYGIYKCPANGSKWECIQAAQETNNITLEFKKDGATWSAHVPLPTDDDFMFKKGSTERQSKTNYTIKGYKRDSYNESKELNSQVLYCDYDATTGEYKLTLVTSEQTQGIVTTIKIAGVYTWKPGNTKWDQKQGEGTLTESSDNIELTLDNKVYVAHIDPPSNQASEDTFWFKLYEKDNLNSTRDTNCKRVYTYDAASNCTMTLVYREETNGIYKTTQTLGVYEWDKSKERWILKQEGKIEKVDISTISMTINGKAYRAYFPLPSDNDFWFKDKGESSTVEYWGLNSYRVDNNSSEWISFAKTTCEHDTTNNLYTVTFINYDWSTGSRKEVIVGKYTCSSTGTAWTQVN